jgi:CO dehydrogenase/acetyl-CoA synthase gamma subunit (corrinoid Fe-S protein)
MIGIITIGNPEKNAPVILTSNVLYEQSILNLLLERAGISCYLLAIDTQGISTGEVILNPNFPIYSIKKVIEDSNLEELVNHRFIIVPRFGTYLKVPLEKIIGWKIFPGPVHVSELPIFIERNWYGRHLRQSAVDLEKIVKLMPEQNCGKCGYPTCLDFLNELNKHKVDVDNCPLLSTFPYKFLRVWLENQFRPVKKYETGVLLDSTRCTGCGVCEKVCPANISSLQNARTSESPPLFKIINGSASIINYEECWRHKYLIPCQICQDNCPYEAISFGQIPIYYEPTHTLPKSIQKSQS